MATKLSKVADADWRGFRRVARSYERELKRIRDATACDAKVLRAFAERALLPKGERQRLSPEQQAPK